jgi:N-acetylmuramoyl-L-alanine amidase
VTPALRGGALAAVLLAAALHAAPGAAAAATGASRESAAAAQFAKAEDAFAALRADARAQRLRENYARVLAAYRAVFERYAGTRQAEQSLLRAGELHTLLFRWTGQQADLVSAQHYYERLIEAAPKSPRAAEARLALAYLALDHFRDPAEAWLRFRDVTTAPNAGEAGAEARRQMKRLARYAPAAVPAPPAATAAAGGQAPPPDPACPPPAAAAPSGQGAAAGPVAPPGAAPAVAPVPAAASPAAPAAAVGIPVSLNRVRDIRHWSNPSYSRVVIDLDQPTNFYSNLLEDRSGAGRPPRLYVDLFNSLVEERSCKPIVVNDGILLGIRAGQFTPESVRVVLDIDGLRTYRVFPMQNPFRIVIDVTGGADAAPGAPPAAPAPPVLSALPGVALSLSAPPPPVLTTAPAPGAPPAPAPAPRVLTVPSVPSVPAEPVPALAPLPPPVGAAAPSAAAAPTAPAASATVPPAAPAAAAPSATFGGTAPSPAAKASPAAPRAPAPPSAAAKLSLARQLGLGVRRIVIDAGHGAHDPGAIGVGGLQEKDVTLDIALRVRTVLQAGGYETVLTRDRDVYLPLEERTALANTARGDLFLSVHCNASDAGNLNGVETYFLNLASSRRAMATAARENSMAVANMSDLQDLLKEIYNSKMDESSRFADAVQRSLHATLHRKYREVKDLGVKQAPFYVLIGAQMPSVLAEVSFINHAVEGRRLADPAYRQLVAQAIADGVRRYVRTVKTAALAPAAEATP